MKRPMSISRASGKVVVRVQGDLDAQYLRRTLTDLADNQGNLNLTIDLRGTDSIDHNGVMVLVRATQRMREHGGDLVVIAPKAALSEALDGYGMTIADATP
jgi:anti-sigma B factor antagonist